MQTWICKYDLGLVGGSARGAFCDFDRFSSFNFCICEDFDRFSFL